MRLSSWRGWFDDTELRAPITRAGVAIVALLAGVGDSVPAQVANHAIRLAAVIRHLIAIVTLLAEEAVNFGVTAVRSVLAIGAARLRITVKSVRR